MWPGNNIGYFGPRNPLRGRCRSANGLLWRRRHDSDRSGWNHQGLPSLPTAAWAGGNIREHALREIWERGPPALPATGRSGSVGLLPDLLLRGRMSRGCTWTAFSPLSRPGNNPIAASRARTQKSSLRERSAIQAPPGEPSMSAPSTDRRALW
jgi:hypothetical protein